LEKYGYAEELDVITPQMLYEAWRTMVTTARLEVLVLGADAEGVEQRLTAALRSVEELRRPGEVRPVPLHAAHPMPVQPTAEYAEPVEAVQGKLAMLFTLDAPVVHADLSKMRMAVALLGGTPTSRLFMNVREKQSLCYYCSAGFTQLGGCLSVDSGVEFENTEKTKQAVLHEIEALIHGEIPEKELEDARRYLRCALEGVGDSLPGMENWVMGEISRGTLDTPEEVARQLEDVTAQDVKEMLKRFHLSVVYTLTAGGAGHDE
jgi:predicted Zn-dependent peptidase